MFSAFQMNQAMASQTGRFLFVAHHTGLRLDCWKGRFGFLDAPSSTYVVSLAIQPGKRKWSQLGLRASRRLLLQTSARASLIELALDRRAQTGNTKVLAHAWLTRQAR